MSYKIKTIPSFDKDFKRLYKRYRSLPDDIKQLVEDLQINPLMGVDLGNGVHKIRLGIKSKGAGKRGGARIITHTDVVVDIKEGTILFFALYDKSDQESIPDKIIKELLNEVGIE